MTYARQGTADRFSRRSRWLAALLLLSLAAVGTWATVCHETWLAAYWLQCLQTAPDEEVPALVACLGGLEDDGLPALVACLGSNRQVVREHALAFLKEQMRTWESEPARSGNWQRLADVLADSAPVFRGWASQQSAVLAETILRARLPGHVDRMQLAARCREVFRHTRGGQQTAPQHELPLAVALGHTDRPSPHASSAEAANLDHNPGQTSADLPGNGGPAANEPRRLGSAALGESGTRLRLPGESAAGAEPSAGAAHDRFTIDDPAPSEVAPAVWEDRDLLSRMETAEVLSLFREAAPGAQHAAEHELTRRGFRHSHVELARHLADPNPIVRRQWAEQLPRLASIDPRPWLWWLTSDSDADVRHAAYSLLATSNDLPTRRRLMEAARSDPDPRIQAMGARLAGMR